MSTPREPRPQQRGAGRRTTPPQEAHSPGVASSGGTNPSASAARTAQLRFVKRDHNQGEPGDLRGSRVSTTGTTRSPCTACDDQLDAQLRSLASGKDDRPHVMFRGPPGNRTPAHEFITLVALPLRRRGPTHRPGGRDSNPRLTRSSTVPLYQTELPPERCGGDESNIRHASRSTTSLYH
jgi:hypothetical protein